jgi:hypothetical protein
MPKLFSKLVSPWYPSTALGLEKGNASLVQLERARGNGLTLRRAASIKLDDSLISPSFDAQNISDIGELAHELSDLLASAELNKQKRWSVSLPEGAIKTAVLLFDTAPGSGSELEEILTWKIERTFGVAMEDLTVSRDRLTPDAQGRVRYLVVAARKDTLAEYETLFEALGWRAGLVVPKHMGESQWLTSNGSAGDSLLVSTSEQGFTAIIFRDKEPLILRTVSCEPEESDDELYRLLLFYRDRRLGEDAPPLTRLLILGNSFSRDWATDITNETLGTDLRSLRPQELGLSMPSREISFDSIAAPAGLAMLSCQ